MQRSEADVVRQFNDAVNARDLERLVTLMSPNHRFVDSAGSVLEGKDACTAAWATFFDSFPDYRSIFEQIDVVAPGQVLVTGRSACAFAPLDGPARWHASVADGLVTEWRVEELAEP